jgi:hypothetical protein
MLPLLSLLHYSLDTSTPLLLLRKRDETLMETESQETSRSLRSSLLINVCPFHYNGVTIYRRPMGMTIYLNYTFSIPDKRL